MPITPFHLGLGFLAREATGASFTAFLVTNVVIDVESGYNLLSHRYPVHTFLHTFVGATIVAVATTIVMFALGRWLPMKRPAIAGGAFAGAWSHVVLDGVMHADSRPFAPWSDDNPLYRVIGLVPLHLACTACAVVAGAIVWRRRGRVTRWARARAEARRRRSPPCA